MKAFSPNAHLVSTSTWGGYNASEWQKCSDCQFTDIHRYINPIDEFAAHFWRPAQATYDLSQSTDFLNKPVIRGEVSFIDTQNTDDASTIITRDTNGVWLHHFLWGGLNPGGLIESYWDEDRHIYYGSTDFRPLYKHYYDFIKDIPLNQGGYVDAVASTSNSALRAWGQKNTAKNLAHLWVFHPSNTWCAAVGGVSGCPTSYVNSPLTGTLTLTGFTPNTTLPITYWQFSKTVGLAQNTTSVTTNASGALTLNLSSLPSTTVDVGIKIGNYSAIPSPSLSPNPMVDYRNFLDLVTQFGQNLTIFNFNQLVELIF